MEIHENKELTRNHDIVSFASHMRHNFIRYSGIELYQGISPSETSFGLHLANLINASGHSKQDSSQSGCIRGCESSALTGSMTRFPFPLSNRIETKRIETHAYTVWYTPNAICLVFRSIRSGFRLIRIGTTHPGRALRNTIREMSRKGRGRSARVDGGGSRFDCAPPLVGGERMRELN